MSQFLNLLVIDPLGVTISFLVLFVAISVAVFSARYLKGDRKQRSFYLNLLSLTILIVLMVNADNLLLFFSSWVLGNFFLTQLMQHKKEWIAARNSSRLALKNFIMAAFFLGLAFLILSVIAESFSIKTILASQFSRSSVFLVSFLLLIGAMAQCGLWPFHRWLISSLNSPTPVSAIMHAGLVNGGGFILARFAPLYFDESLIFTVIFIVGGLSAFIGTLWKLVQSDVKRMLACSTLGQMGFMVAQCGLGLFPAAIGHLCWHGLFKAYLFLASGSAAKDSPLAAQSAPTFRDLTVASICGLVGTSTFSFFGAKTITNFDSNLFLVCLAFITGIQCALTLLGNGSRIVSSMVIVGLFGAFYGLSVRLISNILSPLDLYRPQPLNAIHLIAIAIFTFAWAALVYLKSKPESKRVPTELFQRLYVWTLNASQPDPMTITAFRNHYKN